MTNGGGRPGNRDRGARLRTRSIHGAAVCWFTLLAAAVSYPLIRDPAAQIPGAGPGDNVVFLWNFWWFRFALDESGLSVFHTPYLFAPFGTSLVLHTHTALEALAGATLLRGVSLVTAHNLVLLAGLAANGIAAYALAFYHVRRAMPALLAGVIFASSAFIAIRLLGHFNLVHAWVIPIAVLAWIACLRRPTAARGATVAVAFGAVTYSDYYYLTYCVLFAAAWWALGGRRVEFRRSSTRFARLERLVIALMILAAGAIVAILVSGGFRVEVGPLSVSASHIRNPVAGLWLLALLWIGLHVRPVFSRDAGSRPTGGRTLLPALLPAAVVYAVIVLPLAIPTVALVVSGNYVSPSHGWQSGPRGIDLLTMALGNPLHPLYGSISRGAYDRLGIDMMEQAAWIGIVPLLLIGFGLKTRAMLETDARRWLVIGVLFLVWSVGSFLNVAGVETGLPLPQALARYVPIVANARMPGRAIVMVQLAAAVLCAIMVSRQRWPTPALWGAVLVSVADGAAIPLPMYRIPPASAVEAFVRAEPRPGSVLEIPAGLRDGLGELGRMDHRAFVYQSIHERPLVGGFVARLAPDVRNRYLRDPVLMAMIRLGEHSEVDLPPALAESLRAHGIEYVVVNADAVARPLRELLETRGLLLVTVDGNRELYAVR